MMASEDSTTLLPLLTSELMSGIESKVPSLRILITTSGSRVRLPRLNIHELSRRFQGDIQPYLALACELKKRGHTVFIATEKRMQKLVEEFDISYLFIDGDPAGVLFEPETLVALRNASFMQLISLSEKWDKNFDKSRILDSYFQAAKDSQAQVVIGAALSLTQSYCVAEATGALWIPMILGPTIPTGEFPLWALAGMIPCSCLNRWSYTLAFSMLWSTEKKFINPWRKDKLGLQEIKSSLGMMAIIDELKPPVIVAASPVICPFQRIPGDYPHNVIFEGFIYVPSSDPSTVDADLLRYLDNETARPVIYLGFGSMPAPDPQEVITLAIDICKQSNCRAILIAGWSELNEENVALKAAMDEGLIIWRRAVAHDWLFPRVKCIIHHGGVCTRTTLHIHRWILIQSIYIHM